MLQSTLADLMGEILLTIAGSTSFGYYRFPPNFKRVPENIAIFLAHADNPQK